MIPNLVSVVVPCYNQAQYLSEALNSVVAQTYGNWECIIVNDGSPDNTEEIAKRWYTKDPRIKYLNRQNGGLSSARNAGIAVATGEFILPLDADDKIYPDYLELAVPHLRTNENIKLVYADAELFGQLRGSWNLPAYSLKKLAIRNIIYCSCLFRKVDFDSYGGYREDMIHGLEDWDLWLGILKNGGEVYRIPKTLFCYRTKEGSMSRELLNSEKTSVSRKIVYKHHEDFYDKQFGDPIQLLNIIQDRDNEISELKRKLKLIDNSKLWRVRKIFRRNS
jgi:glycosyltransferase involved in cell wall biosynthesis